MRTWLIALIACCVAGAGIGDAQDGGSHARATQLVKRLGGSKMTSFAAPMPDDPSRFVAALHIPGIQLLVISATYPTPSLLAELIAKNDHQRVYLDLNSAGERKGRFFVEDMGADGIRPDRERDAAFDITWRDATQRILYNGNWKEQKLSEAEYRERFARDAADYDKILEVLLTAHQSQASSPITTVWSAVPPVAFESRSRGLH